MARGTTFTALTWLIGGRSRRPPVMSNAIDLVLPHLGPGGAQKVAAALANRWATAGRTVRLITLQAQPPDAHVLDRQIERVVVESARGRRSVLDRAGQDLSRLAAQGAARSGTVRSVVPDGLRASNRYVVAGAVGWIKERVRHRPWLALLMRRPRLRRLRRVLAEGAAGTIVSFLGPVNVMTVIAAQGLGRRLIISERNDPARQRLNEPWQSLRPLLYPLADVVSANSEGALAAMEAYVPREKLVFLPNPLAPTGRPSGVRKPVIACVARLVPQKGVDVLLRAFASVAAEADTWRLEIAGDGPERQALLALSCELGITERAVLHGHIPHPDTLLARASVFVLPSRFEGTPNALLEAMQMELACVVTDASPGPLRLVEHGASGLVVPADDYVRLAAVLRRLTSDPELRDRLGCAARERVRPFVGQAAFAAWDEVVGV
jgi:glycosyltransferase involved in cell wall biosynthesis